MIVVSMVFVIVAAVTLLVGVFVGEENINYIYASIGACLGAFVFLVLGVLRGRPSRKPVLTEEEAAPLAESQNEEPRPTEEPATASDDDAAFRPPARSSERVEFDDDDDDDEDVEIITSERAVEEPALEEPVVEGPAVAEAGPEPDADEDEVAYEYVEVEEPAGEDDEVEYEYVEIDEAGNEIPIDPPLAQPVGDTPPAAGDRVADETPVETAVGRTVPRREPFDPPAGQDVGQRGDAQDEVGAGGATEPRTHESDAGHPLSQASNAARDARRTEDVLLGVSGVGPAKRAVLLGHFGSFDGLMGATTDDLSQVSGISTRLAERIREALDRAQP